jgi:hypothetical protein
MKDKGKRPAMTLGNMHSHSPYGTAREVSDFEQT